jgi:hypothetical protein
VELEIELTDIKLAAIEKTSTEACECPPISISPTNNRPAVEIVSSKTCDSVIHNTDSSASANAVDMDQRATHTATSEALCFAHCHSELKFQGNSQISNDS